MGEDGRVVVTHDGPVAVVTLDRPSRLNTLTQAMVEQFAAVSAELHADPGVRAIVLTGAGDRAFCAGGDLRDLLPPAIEARADLLNPDPVRRFLSGVFTPVVAAVRGFCMGAGFELLLRCDLRVVAEDAVFGLPEPRWGLIPGDGTHLRLPRQVPYAVAMELLLTGASIDAHRALAVGLVNQVLPAGEVLDRALEVARGLAANGPLAVQTSKEIVVRGQALETGFALEHALNSRVLGSADAREGVRAFLAKDTPVYTGT